MKRNILLGFLLTGLVLLEWGCGCQDWKENYKIVEFERIDCISYQKYIAADTVKFDTLLFSAFPVVELASSFDCIGGSQFSAYATSPCEPIRFLVNTFDSVKVTTVISNNIVDISSLIGVVKTTYYRNPNYSYDIIPLKDKSGVSAVLSSLYLPFIFGFVNPPSSMIDSAITFQFFDSDGNVFETTTDPIIITP